MKKILIMFSTIIATVAVLYSCKKSDSLDPLRMFMPGTAISIVNNTATTATITWTGSVNTDTTVKNLDYLIQVATDSSFNNIVYTGTTKNYNLTLGDDILLPKQKYVARLQVKGVDGRPDSQWLISKSFSIAGENLFLSPYVADIQYYTAILRWTHQDGLTKVTVTSGGISADYLISADTLLLTGLKPNTSYSAELFKGSTSKGTTSFTTKDAGIYTLIITPADTLNKVIDTCSNGAVIGLTAGTYNCVDATGAAANINILKKNISIGSVSGNPADTKVNFKEVTLKGDGAGVKLQGITFDGTANAAAYFVNLIGETANGAAAAFGSIYVDNCNINNVTNCLVRASQGTAANTQKMQDITFNNCFATVKSPSGTSYNCFMMDKMLFNSITLTNSTFTDFGRGLISASTAFSPAPSTAPVITINKCTLNDFGSGAKYAILDANSNVVTFKLTNSIFGNAPMSSSTVANAAVRYGAGSTVTISNLNAFKFTNGAATPANLTWPSGISAPMAIDLGWTSSSSDFSLPTGSALRTVATDGGPIGDPRWAR